MFKSETHFEQIPLEMVRRIVEEQVRREIAAGQTQGTKEKTLEENVLKVPEQSLAISGTIPQVEA